ncbi:MAG: ISNCY family transposase [Clostridia bacterium]|nr:ISNCY family transposase [Clostridia bacterium]
MIAKYKTLLPAYLAGLVNGKYSLAQAAASTGYSKTWLCLMKKKYLKYGYSILDHKNRGRIPHNKTPAALKNKIVALYATPAYQNINFKYFAECLRNYEKINISYSTLRNIMHEFKIISPEAHRVKKPQPAHRPRVRRDNFGDLLQIDGTPFQWFQRFGDNKRYCMQGAIDDATGKITGLYITEYECLYGYLEILRQTINSYGCPREIYSDRAAIFCVTPKKKKDLTAWEELAGIHDKRTQWQRILSDLSIRQILAWSPEAKGRVERMWLTLQKRLPTELYIAGCDTVEKANIFLQKYIKNFNDQFGCDPMKPETFFLPCSENLDVVLSAQIPRKADGRGCISFHSYKFAVEAPRVACRNLILHISERGIFARFPGDNKFYNVRLLDDHIFYGLGETMPQVVADIIYRYMYAYAKEVSA